MKCKRKDCEWLYKDHCGRTSEHFSVDSKGFVHCILYSKKLKGDE